MKFFMTFFTSRNYIKIMFRRITKIMMVLLCRFGTIMTEQKFGRNQFTSNNSVMNNVACFPPFGMLNVIAFFILSLSYFAFFGLSITFLCGLTFSASIITIISFSVYSSALFCLAIFFYAFQVANFTRTYISILIVCLFVKFRNWFDLLAFSTLFCLNCFSHSLFLCKRLRLEPIAAHTAVGLLYTNGTLSKSQ